MPIDAGTVYTWFEDMALTSLVGTGESITINPGVTTTYYVIGNQNGCISATAANVTVTVTEP